MEEFEERVAPELRRILDEHNERLERAKRLSEIPVDEPVEVPTAQVSQMVREGKQLSAKQLREIYGDVSERLAPKSRITPAAPYVPDIEKLREICEHNEKAEAARRAARWDTSPKAEAERAREKTAAKAAWWKNATEPQTVRVTITTPEPETRTVRFTTWNTTPPPLKVRVIRNPKPEREEE
jgi:hypothetical protein